MRPESFKTDSYFYFQFYSWLVDFVNFFAENYIILNPIFTLPMGSPLTEEGVIGRSRYSGIIPGY